jgi:hypothetical protein
VAVDPTCTMVLMCGPEIMIRLGMPILMQHGIPAATVYALLCNQTRPHRTRDGKVSEQVYCINLTTRLTAASSDHCEVPPKG